MLHGHYVIVDVYQGKPMWVVFCSNYCSESNTGGTQSNAGVEQILCMGIGPKGKYPYLFVCHNSLYNDYFTFFQALINKELIIYKGFSYPSTLHSGHLQLRFSKVGIYSIL